MVLHNCFDFSIGTSKVFGFEAKNFRAHDVQKKNSEAIPCPADTPRGSLVGPQPKFLSILILRP
jgi:hypothetical protein